jgi:hypothetical protein
VPVTLEQLLGARIGELPAPARALLQVCAVAARPLALDVAAAAADVADPADALSRLRVERLLRVEPHGAELWIEPYHDRIRAAVTAAVTEDDARHLHARIAAALDGRAGTTAAQLAAHWRAAGEDARARALARTAAAEAEQTFAFHRAADLYRLALETRNLPAAERRELARRHAECLAGAGRLAEAIEVIATVAGDDARDDATETGARQLRRLELLEIDCRLRSGDLAHGLAAARALLAELGVRVPAGQAATIAMILAQQLRLRLRGLGFTRRTAAEVPAGDLERIDALWSLTTAFMYASPAISGLVQVHHLRAALEAGEPTRVARALCTELPRLSFGADGARGERRLAAVAERARALCAEAALPELTAVLEASLGLAAHLRGRWRESADRAARAEQLGRDHLRQRWIMCVVQFHRVAASWYLGETAAIALHMPRYLAEAEELGDAHTLEMLRVTRGNVYWLVLGRPDEAREMATAVLPRGNSAGQFHVHDYLQLQAHVQIDLYEGAGRAALERVERIWPAFEHSMLRRYRQIRIEALYLRARSALAAVAESGAAAANATGAAADAASAATTLDGAGATAAAGADRARLIELARRAGARLAAESLPWARVVAAAVVAAAAHAAGERERLPALLDAAITAASAAEMHLLAHALRHRRGTWCASTDSDTDAAALAAEAEAAMRRERIADPAAVIRLLVPG